MISNKSNAAELTQDASLRKLVPRFVQRFTDLWWECDTCMPSLGQAYTTREQTIRERHLDQFLDALAAEMKHPPQNNSERHAAQERIFSAFGTFAKAALDFEQRHLDVLLSGGFTAAATEFTQAARRFDPAVSGSDIFQASRNAWAMNGLQMLLGLPGQLTPARCAFSMLYPYTDNYLDDPQIAEETKAAFNRRFARRLAGEDVEPADPREKTIYDLVGMIEDQFERSHYPRVFESLLAIHRAQEKSIRLLRCNSSPYEVDVLRISFEKGGTSVLADGYLVAGSLSEAQAKFLFDWGAFLQLVDDLQDVEQDSQDGLLTIFSQTARRWRLDALTNRTLNLGMAVLDGVDCFDAQGSEPLKELMRSSALQLTIESAGLGDKLYSKGYLRGLEVHSPFRFSALRKRRKKFARQLESLMTLLESFATPDDVKGGHEG